MGVNQGVFDPRVGAYVGFCGYAKKPFAVARKDDLLRIVVMRTLRINAMCEEREYCFNVKCPLNRTTEELGIKRWGKNWKALKLIGEATLEQFDLTENDLKHYAVLRLRKVKNIPSST